MPTILVQRSHDTRFVPVLSELDAAFDTEVVSDDALGEAIEGGRGQIAGFVLFHLSPPAIRAARLLVDERFNAPTTPMAYLGQVGAETDLPYGVSPVDRPLGGALVALLSRPRRVSVLVVEDDAGIRDVLQLSLSRHFDVAVAEDGAEALERLERADYDIVVLDVMLPRVSGDEVFRHVKATRPDAAVLVITAYDTEERELDYTFGGADGYLAKPFASNLAFRRELVEALGRRHARAELAARARRADAAEDARRAYARRMRAYR